MSVHQEISENPAANSITKPNDATFLSKDVERKINLYNIFTAFQVGKAPSNDQIDRTLSWIQNKPPIDQSKLSSEGRGLIEDVKEILETARLLVKEKNADELVQNFLYSTRGKTSEAATSAKAKSNVDHPVTKDDAQKDLQEATQHLRTLGKLIFTNSEFRKLLQDASIIGRDIATDAATHAADMARPTEEQLSQVDESAPADSWVGADGKTYGANEAAPESGIAEKREKAKAAKEEAKRAKDEAKRQGKAAVEDPDAAITAADEGLPVDPTTDLDDPKTKKSWKDQTLGKVSQENRDLAQKHYESSKDYLKEKFPQERRDRFLARFKKVIVEQQRHRDYQEAIDFLLKMFENYRGYAGTYADQGQSAGMQYRNHPTYKEAESQLRTLLERFANGNSIQPILDAINTLYQDGQKDPELKAWYKELGTYTRRVLQEPGYVTNVQANEDGRKLRETGKQFFSEKYKGHQDKFFDAVKVFFAGFTNDPLNKRFGNNWKKLAKDLLFDSDGHLKFKSHLWSDVRHEILPPLARSIGAIPIPRIEYSDKETDLVIENLILESQNILPNIFEVEAKNYFRFSQYKEIKDKTKHSVWISFSQIQADLRNVAFYFHRKAGFPKIRDHGLADVFLLGKGISGYIHLESTEQKGSYFNIKDIKIKIDNLKFKIHDSNHQILYATLRPLATRLVKRQISKAIADAIRSGLVQLDGSLAEIRDRMKETKDDDSVSKTQVIKDAFSKKEPKKEESESKGKFQLVSRRESKIIDYTPPNSYVEKASAGNDLALQGEGWKSPIFDVVDKSVIDRAGTPVQATA